MIKRRREICMECGSRCSWRAKVCRECALKHRIVPISESLKNFKVNTVTGCHEYLGRLTPTGYGTFYHAGRRLSAHRASWEASRGPILGGLLVCHKCDNPKCINVEHLFLGTDGDNMRDRVAKGRIGITHPMGKPSKATLDIEKVTRIRSRYASGERAIKLAAEYGVTDSCIYRVLRCETWPEWSIAARKLQFVAARKDKE